MQLTRRILNGDMAFGQGLANFATGSESVAQNVVTRLRSFQGEWFMDTSFGVPYFQSILVKPANIPLSESLIKAEILGTQGVDQLLNFSFAIDTKSRRATVVASISDLYGNISDIRVTI